jgi:tRNA-specific 2-thiouridylase
MFVTKIMPETNQVMLGEVDELVKNGMVVNQINPMKYEEIPTGVELITQVRYNDPGALSILSAKGDEVSVEFLANVKGIAPGQSAVFYEGNDVVGGGIIYKSL